MSKKVIVPFLTAIGASITSYCALTLHHTVYLDKYKDFVTYYRRGIEVELTDKLKQLSQQVLEDLKFLPEEEKPVLKPFHVFGFDVFHAGSLNKQYGAALGIPYNYTYTDVNNIYASNIMVNNKPIDWDKKDAKNLLNALVLSEDAQKYGIAREILKITKEMPLNDAHALVTLILSSSSLYITACITNKLYEKHPLIRRILAVFLILFIIGAWIGCKDKIHYDQDKEIDETLSQLGPDYIKGGKEFYEKMIQRNIALRSLMGSEGQKYFSVNGNFNFFFRQDSVPLSHKKNFFESKIKYEI